LLTFESHQKKISIRNYNFLCEAKALQEALKIKTLLASIEARERLGNASDVASDIHQRASLVSDYLQLNEVFAFLEESNKVFALQKGKNEGKILAKLKSTTKLLLRHASYLRYANNR
jgi:hypothetical protein